MDQLNRVINHCFKHNNKDAMYVAISASCDECRFLCQSCGIAAEYSSWNRIPIQDILEEQSETLFANWPPIGNIDLMERFQSRVEKVSKLKNNLEESLQNIESFLKSKIDDFTKSIRQIQKIYFQSLEKQNVEDLIKFYDQVSKRQRLIQAMKNPDTHVQMAEVIDLCCEFRENSKYYQSQFVSFLDHTQLDFEPVLLDKVFVHIQQILDSLQHKLSAKLQQSSDSKNGNISQEALFDEVLNIKKQKVDKVQLAEDVEDYPKAKEQVKIQRQDKQEIVMANQEVNSSQNQIINPKNNDDWKPWTQEVIDLEDDIKNQFQLREQMRKNGQDLIINYDSFENRQKKINQIMEDYQNNKSIINPIYSNQVRQVSNNNNNLTQIRQVSNNNIYNSNNNNESFENISSELAEKIKILKRDNIPGFDIQEQGIFSNSEDLKFGHISYPFQWNSSNKEFKVQMKYQLDSFQAIGIIDSKKLKLYQENELDSFTILEKSNFITADGLCCLTQKQVPGFNIKVGNTIKIQMKPYEIIFTNESSGKTHKQPLTFESKDTIFYPGFCLSDHSYLQFYTK